MVGIIIATHGNMANGIMDSVELIMGKPKNCLTLGLRHGDDIGLFADKIIKGVADLDQGDGILILTDLFAASPYNQAAISYKKLVDHPYRLISGLNLPMLIESFNQRMRGADLDTITKSAIKSGKDGIKEFFEEMSKTREG